jgi:phosphoribosylformimino-5-aminoimidazole carboxamide ribotide isomerase
MIKIFPAIDLKNGQCVRLRQGRADESTVYSDDPSAMALRWRELGAEFIHVVDLDGAFNGRPAHTAVFRRLASAPGALPFEVGGGLRTDADIREVLAAGAARAIIGSRAAEDPDSLGRLAAEFGAKLAVGIDARGGFVQTKGWVDTTKITALDLAARMAELGVGTIIFTDTATDGMMSGPNLDAMAAMADRVPDVSIVASGGVSTPADVRALAALGRANITAAIVGKALYENPQALPDFIAAGRA